MTTTRRHNDILLSPDIPPRTLRRKPALLVSKLGGGMRRIEVGAAAIVSFEFEKSSLYLGVEHDPWERVPRVGGGRGTLPGSSCVTAQRYCRYLDRSGGCPETACMIRPRSGSAATPTSARKTGRSGTPASTPICTTPKTIAASAHSMATCAGAGAKTPSRVAPQPCGLTVVKIRRRNLALGRALRAPWRWSRVDRGGGERHRNGSRCRGGDVVLRRATRDPGTGVTDIQMRWGRFANTST